MTPPRTTKKDLSGWGSFLIMGVIGLIVAMVINIFLQSTVFAMAVSAIGVLIFAGLTAYDTQRIKSMYAYVAGTDMVGKVVVMAWNHEPEDRPGFVVLTSARIVTNFQRRYFFFRSDRSV